MKSIFILSAYFILIHHITVFSQMADYDVTITKDQKDKDVSSYIETDLNFISDAVFMGRKDSIAAPYLYPSVLYHHKSGFYAKGSFSFLTQSDESRIDLYLFTAGFDFLSNKLYGDLSATKYFFNDDSYNVLSSVEADITANLIYDFDFLNFSVTASTYINDNSTSDFFLSSYVSHDFLTADNKFQTSPNIGLYLGSQNFYEAYYINNRMGNRQGSGSNGAGGSPLSTATSLTFQESENFNLMAVELSLPMWYMHKSLTISFVPTLALPQNKANIIIDDAIVIENLESTFYWMLGISYKFN